MEHNQTSQPNEQLEARVDELAGLVEIPHGETRQNELERELAHTTFEVMSRFNEVEVAAGRPPIVL